MKRQLNFTLSNCETSYDRTTNTINLDPKHLEDIEAIVHEINHAVLSELEIPKEKILVIIKRINEKIGLEKITLPEMTAVSFQHLLCPYGENTLIAN